jgi:hypothetical protein
MLIQAYDPCVVQPAGPAAAASCAAAAADYYRGVMVYVPGGAAAGALAVLAASWSLEMLEAVLKPVDGARDGETSARSSLDGDAPRGAERRTQPTARRDAATQIADASVPLLSGQLGELAEEEEEADDADDERQRNGSRAAAPAESASTSEEASGSTAEDATFDI